MDTNRKYYASLCHAHAMAQAERLKKSFHMIGKKCFAFLLMRKKYFD
jgi:hypothetical protein